MSQGSGKDIHVLHVVPGLGPGGMELVMAGVIRGLSDGMRHSIACLKGEPEIAESLPPQTDIHCFRSRPNEPQLPARLGRLIRALRPSVIHARNWGAWPDTAVGRLLAPPPVPLIFSFHGLGRAGYMPLRRRAASRILVRMTSHLFTVSLQSKRMLMARWGWPEGKVQVIPNGVDTERFRPADRPRRPGPVVVGSVGNLRPVKNHALLLRACAELARRGLRVKVRIAGEGELRAELQALADALGLGGRVELPGRVRDVPGFLHGLDVFVLSSDSEQHPNALNEAMACGLPCIATDVGSVEEILAGGEYGCIVPPGDVAALTAGLERLIRDPALRRRLASAGRRRVCEHYSLRKMLTAYEEMYRRWSAARG